VSARRLGFVLAWLVALSAIAAVTVSRPDGLLAAYPFNDDSFFYFTLARAMSEGRFFANASGEFVNGFQPLYALVLWPLAWLVRLLAGADPYALLRGVYALHVLLLGFGTALFSLVVCRIASAWTGSGAQRIVAGGGIVAGVWFIANARILEVALNGLETGLLIVLLLAGVYLLLPHAGPDWEYAAFGALMGLMVLARIDTIVFASVGLITYAWARRLSRRRACAMAGIGVAVCAPWFVLNMVMTGVPVPSSGLAYAAGSVERSIGRNLEVALTSGLTMGVPFAPASIALPLLVVAAALVHLVRGPTDLLRAYLPAVITCVLYVSSLILFYVVFFSAPWYIARYVSPAVVLLNVVLAAVAIGWFARLTAVIRPGWKSRALFVGSAAALATMLALVWLGRNLQLRYVNPEPIAMYESHYALVKCLPTTDVIASFQSGVLEYFHPLTLNLDGKMNIDAARAVRAGQLDAYFLAQRPSFLVDWRDIVEQRLSSQALADYAEKARTEADGRLTVLWQRTDFGAARPTC
jgi:hypothetical protein